MHALNFHSGHSPGSVFGLTPRNAPSLPWPGARPTATEPAKVETNPRSAWARARGFSTFGSLS